MSALRARLGSSTVCARKIFLQSINNSKHFAARSVSAKIQNDSTIFRAFSNRQYSTATEQKKDGETLKGTSEKREFQAETRMLLDIVARSLYSDKEVFIRELISNASDALEKFRYLSVSAATEGKQLEQTDRALEIKLITDKQNRTITFQDSGIGMTKEELTQNLGTIARSGSKSFIEEIKKQGADQASSIIGQFGVGFYSAFMVADKIEVSGVYEIQEADGVPIGTKIVVYLKTDCREFSDDETVKGIIKKYSNFIGSPIILNDQQVNSIKPLWLMEPKEVTQEQHVEFYRFIGNSYDKPRFTLHYKTDAPLSIRAVLYVPEGKPGLFELSRDSDVGVSLYSRKILIKSKADNILPKWLRFVKGVVDSEDIPLNLSRELLQNSNLIIKLRTVLTNRFLKFLNDSASKDPVGYDTFYRDYSIFLKEGIVTSHSPLEREDIAKLLRFESSKLEKGVRTSMAEYSSRQKNEQKTIYYLAAPSRELAETSPYFESLKKRDLEVLFCYDTYDELVLLELKEFGGRQLFRVMSTLDINKIENEEEKSPDKKQIEAEEKEMMLKTEAENNEINAESKEGEGLVKAALSADVIEQGREVKPKFIPIGAIKMPGFFTRNSDKTKEEEAIEKDPENDKADESAKPKRNHFQFLHTCPFTKFLHHPTQNDKDDSNIDEKKGSRLFNVKYPKIFKKGSSKDPEATLASMETLEDKLDTPNDGMENVKLDPEVNDIVVCCIVVLVLLAVIIGVIVGARAGPPAERPLRLGRYITTISSCGPVEGILDEGVYKFYSIPYALPPIEEKRFTYATPLNNISMCWNDTLQAHNPGPLCMQFLENGTITGEEDCLTLDVVTPHVSLSRLRLVAPLYVVMGSGAGGGSARRATAGGAAGSGLAAVDADIEAILGTFDSEVPEQRRFMSSMQQLFYYYVWHGTSPGPDTGLIAVEIMPKYVLVKIVMVTLSIDGYLTNEGIEYLRIFLHLPPEIVPATLKRSARTETVRRGAVGRPDAPARAAEDRSAYRRAPTTPGAPHDKKADVGPGSADVEFVPSSDINKTLIMEDDEIELISGGDKLQEVAQVLQEFIRKNETTFTFPNLNGNNKRVILWAALFQHLQNKASAPIHTLCLAAIRVLSRDKSELENLICEKWITTLIERAGLYNFVGINEESMAPLELPQKEIAIEALKCLCNVAFNSEVARALCAHTSIAQGLIARLRIYKDIPFKEEIMLFDIKLLFILTALRQDIKMKIKDELHGMDYLICCLNEQLKEATPSGENSAMDQDQHFFFTDNQQAISCEILKSMFNLILRPGLEESISEADESMYLKLMPVLTSLLYTQTTNEDKLMELRSNVANLLTSVPPPFYTYLTPVLDPGETAEFVFEGKNMDALQSLVQLLQYRLTGTTNLSPILTVMNKAARGSRVARKFLRRAVLPPLRDVSRPPEHGGELRNQLCRLLTTPVSSVRDLVAEFLFVLCKEKVGRMVKYTGFGNAAGHLAQKGLLGGGGGGGRYSSSSDDSDTEEYLEAAPRIDPVKEYEAMKLVNLFDKMVSEGVVRPARVGPDGRPQAIDHVLELRDHPPNRPQS
ncbi:hypothetical protein MSG28_001517 [Choristoneura fumiferana]|uniref:Uncharacterized protein n=1 Tax=Choristoneura fumiferana TaxID=7141 RepID=A0ACC0KUF7_CHOFU|nr:hypothetical protein MSG28_001517 [Choristoneura fumiferana]